MTALDPRVNFDTLTDVEMASLGLDEAEAHLDHLATKGYTNGKSLAIIVGVVAGESPNREWVELGRRRLGNDGEDFTPDIDPYRGNLATTIIYGENSIDASYHNAHIPEGPQRRAGAVQFVARVQTKNGWEVRKFVGAASGVQDHFSQAIVCVALTHMAALWALKMQATHGEPCLNPGVAT